MSGLRRALRQLFCAHNSRSYESVTRECDSGVVLTYNTPPRCVDCGKEPC